MSFNILRPIRHEEDPDLFGGPNGNTEDFMLQSGGTDKVLLSEGNEGMLLQSNGDLILLSTHQFNDENLLQSNGDLIYLSGGTDELLITGNNTTSSLLDSGLFVILSNI